MTNTELDGIISWCRKKMSAEKKNPFVNSNRRQGYEEAMLNVMSYLHGLKEAKTNDQP